jgi:hypothetical protein
MNPATVLTTHALIAIGYAIPLLFAPYDFLWLYGATIDVDSAYLARLFGSALAAVSAITWMAREAPEGPALDAICAGLAIGCALGTVVSLHHQLVAPASGALGWTTVAIFAGLTAAYVALWFARSARSASPPLRAG